MNKIILTLICCGLTTIAKSQNTSVEKSTFGVQTGFLGVWGHNESKLSNQIALRTEIGFDTGIWAGSFYDKTGVILVPVITMEPRWYYNLNKRVKKERRIDGNSGNFISLKTSYHPDWFVISNYDNMSIVSDISIVPTWGIRRNIGNHFTYETGIGIGYLYYFAKDAGYAENKSDVAVNLHLRIGYRFK
ncbi:hypothetical protein SAMN05443667_104205 [Flavobacterium gillisiae]|uniref:Outer membrane protein beta-barrel domain-containing protein n=1 Tax=Flavobacterium gillisiae TaxID=150146 RepID=A0A1H4B673_9FLAO|nr:hypothetical protein [Flavobacterium gillisiae]SEA43619.1 hypothetical protein SAMN05443667_104205 [Flavobacterium gillisiae]